MSHPRHFRALRIYKGDNGIERRVEEFGVESLPAGDLVVEVGYSSINYKDALSATGVPGVTKDYPHTPGIDAAGSVLESATAEWRPGDRVIVGGADFGSTRWGGYSEIVRVPASLVTRLPEGLTIRDAMCFGTAGFTAALCADRIRRHLTGTKSAYEVLVTGASGGVGSFAVAFLAAEGFRVTAATGKVEEADYLRSLGAADILGREDVTDGSGRPLLASRWHAVVDTVGGSVLSTAVRATAPGGIVTACGNAGGAKLDLSVYPFILRGITLAGIDTPSVASELRGEIWRLLAGPWRHSLDHDIVTECPLSDIEKWIGRILQGGVRGRIVVRVGHSTV